MFVFQNVKAGVDDLWNGLDIKWDTVLDEIARSSANMLSLTNDQASSSVPSMFLNLSQLLLLDRNSLTWPT